MMNFPAPPSQGILVSTQWILDFATRPSPVKIHYLELRQHLGLMDSAHLALERMVSHRESTRRISRYQRLTSVTNVLPIRCGVGEHSIPLASGLCSREIWTTHLDLLQQRNQSVQIISVQTTSSQQVIPPKTTMLTGTRQARRYYIV
jgi:hypothetical protein